MFNVYAQTHSGIWEKIDSFDSEEKAIHRANRLNEDKYHKAIVVNKSKELGDSIAYSCEFDRER